MRKILLFCTLLFAITVSSQAQFVLSTVPPLAGGNGSGGCTFNLTANRTIILDSLRCSMNAGSFNMDIWYNPSPISGSPSITAANAWVLLGSASVVSSGGNVPQNIPVGLGLVIPAGSTYGFYCGGASASVIYTTHIAGNQTVFSDNNISIESGPLTGYGGSVPVPVNHPRQFNGAAVYRLAATGPNDASVLSLDQPVNFCGGTQN